MPRPEFPASSPIRIEDRPVFNEFFSRYEPETSELTFTNLFIWREHYSMEWSVHRDWLLVFCGGGQACYALQPVGPPSRVEVTRLLLEWLQRDRQSAQPRIERADRRLVRELEEDSGFVIEPSREHFDYVYRTEDLIQLPGKRYHGKRNHLNQFYRSYNFSYTAFPEERLGECLELTEAWCQARHCEEDLSLVGERQAAREAIAHHRELELTCGAAVVGNKVAAFSMGEMLNPRTAVVHIEKADPDIPGIYTLINQQYCENAFPKVPFINREQDLGDEGLRKAKLSYHPDHLVEKFRIRVAT